MFCQETFGPWRATIIDPFAPSEQDPGHGLSPVELGHSAGTLGVASAL